MKILICRCLSIVCIVSGLLLLAIMFNHGLSIDKQTALAAQTLSDDIPNTPATVADTCLTCHVKEHLTRPTIGEMTPALMALQEENSTSEHFITVGHLLLDTVYERDTRFAEPLRQFMDIHQLMLKDTEAAHVALGQVGQTLMRLELDITSGRWDVPKPTSSTVHLALVQRTSRPLIQLTTWNAWTFAPRTPTWAVVAVHVPDLYCLFMTDNYRGPPPALVGATQYQTNLETAV